MDKISLFGKDFAVTTYADAVPTSCIATKKSAFSDAILFNVTYDLSGVNPSKDLDELTSEEIARIISLRAKTPTITAKDLGLRNFVLNSLNKGKDESDKISLADFNAKLFVTDNFDENGEISESANDTLKSYCKKVCNFLTKGKRNVYFVSMPVSELTGGKFQTWTPDYSDKPRTDVVAYEIDENNLLNAALAAVGQMYATLDTNETSEEEK